ncbi:unnamed protein product [Camellia sinensis]
MHNHTKLLQSATQLLIKRGGRRSEPQRNPDFDSITQLFKVHLRAIKDMTLRCLQKGQSTANGIMSQSTISFSFFLVLYQPTKEEGYLQTQEIVAEQGPKQFNFKTLSSVTEGFHAKNKLGNGGFCSSVQGEKLRGREIAVKKPLLISDKGKELVLKEMKLLLRSAHHRNIVEFLGFCSHREEMLLVFEFARYGSLDYLLFNSEIGRSDALEWKRTYDIIVGVAQGLLYLHERSHSVIIHCDIKPTNILIDENLVPKVADFGTASLFPQDQTHVNISEATDVVPKVDTYSFGVVVLELISGQKNWLFHDWSSNVQDLRDGAKELYKEGRVSEFMDQKLIPLVVLDQVQLCVHIGVMCIEYDPKLQPTMGRVYSMLSENHSSSSTLVKESMRDGSSLASSTARNSDPNKLANNGSSSGADIYLENKGLPKHRRLTRARRIHQRMCNLTYPPFQTPHVAEWLITGNTESKRWRLSHENAENMGRDELWNEKTKERRKCRAEFCLTGYYRLPFYFWMVKIPDSYPKAQNHFYVW